MTTELLPGATVTNPTANKTQGVRLKDADGKIWMVDDRDTGKAQTVWITLPVTPFDWAAFRHHGVIRRMSYETWMNVSRISSRTKHARFLLEFDPHWEVFTP